MQADTQEGQLMRANKHLSGDIEEAVIEGLAVLATAAVMMVLLILVLL